MLEEQRILSDLIAITSVSVGLSKDSNDNSKDNKDRNDEIKRSINESIKETEESSKLLTTMDSRPKVLETESLFQEKFHRKMRGWRTDLARLANRIDTQGDSFKDHRTLKGKILVSLRFIYLNES